MAINPLRLDPTRTGLLRRAFVRDMSNRMERIRKAVLQLVGEEDAFGIARNGLFTIPGQGTVTEVQGSIDTHLTQNVRWQFATDDKKVEAYKAWLKEQVDANLLSVDPHNKNTPWVQPYIGKAYKSGLTAAYANTNKNDANFDGGQAAFLKQAFEGPVGQSKLNLLSTRAFTQLQGIGPEMDKQMTTILATGLAKGTGPKALAQELAKTVPGLDKKRAMTIARTEIVHAHNEGQLDAFEAMNVEGVGVKAEWSTAHDGKVCPLCAPLEGVVMTVKEARGLLPRHPNCRCAWIPAGVGEHDGGTTTTTWAGDDQGDEDGLAPPGTLPTGQTTGQSWRARTVADRIRDSLKAEHPKLDAIEARAASRWLGADVKISGKLKPGSKAWIAAETEKQAAQEAELAATKAQAEAITKKEKALHSLKVKVGLAKKKLGEMPESAFAPGRGELPELTAKGIEAYVKTQGVELDLKDYFKDSFVKTILEATPSKGVPKLAAQVDALIAKTAEKQTVQKAVAEALEKTKQAEIEAAKKAAAQAELQAKIVKAAEDKAKSKAYTQEMNYVVKVGDTLTSSGVDVEVIAVGENGEYVVKSAKGVKFVAKVSPTSTWELKPPEGWVAGDATAKKIAKETGFPSEINLKKIKDLPGSTKPYLAEDTTTGKQWVVKDSSGSGIAPAHLRSEALADALYRKLGLPVPNSAIIESAGGPIKVSQFIKDGETLAEWQTGKSAAEIQEMYKKIQDGFVADALFANHDVAGLSFDNIFIRKGYPYRIDNGGALTFRAQGGVKTTWGPKVTELKTMLDKSTNPVTAKIFGDITEAQIHEQIEHIVEEREALLALVTDKDVKATLAARIDNLEAMLPAKQARQPVPIGPRSAEYGVTDKTPARVEKARSNGVNLAIDRGDIQDNNVLTWEEIDRTGKPVTHLQFKVTPEGSNKIRANLANELATAKRLDTSIASTKHPADEYGDAIVIASKTASHHAKDGNYNTGTMQSFNEAVEKLAAAKKAKGLDAETKKMLDYYQGLADKVTEAMTKKVTVPELNGGEKLVQYVYTPPVEAPKVSEKARRAIDVRRDNNFELPVVKYKKGLGEATNEKNIFEVGEAYTADMGEGIQLRYVPNDGKFERDSGRALHGIVRISIPEKATQETLSKAVKMAQEIGVSTQAPTPAYEEALYLHRGVYLNKKADDAGYKAIWENAELTDEQKVKKQKAWIKKEMGINVDKVKSYNPQGSTTHADGSGFRTWERWDLPAEKVKKEMVGHTLFHSTGSLYESPVGKVPTTLGKILDSGGEFTSTTARVRKGVSVSDTGGASSTADMNTGGGSYFFTRIKPPTSDLRGFNFKIENLSRQDVVSYGSDKYGSIGNLGERVATIKDYKDFAKNNTANESLFKEGLGLNDLESIVVNDTKEKEATLKVFKARKITHLPDGRPVEEIVLTKQEKAAQGKKIQEAAE